MALIIEESHSTNFNALTTRVYYPLCRNKVLWTPLDCAAANGHARIVKELVSAKAEIDPTDKLKTTPLHLAAKEGHVTAVETLIKHGANLGLRDQRGFNALDWAIEKGHR